MLQFGNQLFGPWAAQLHDFRCRHVGVIGEVEELGIGHGSTGIVVDFNTDHSAVFIGIDFRLHVLSVEKALYGIAAMVGDIDGFFPKDYVFTLSLVSSLEEKQEQKATDADYDTQSSVDEIEADASGQNDGRYDEVLDSMDRFEFDFHD